MKLVKATIPEPVTILAELALEQFAKPGDLVGYVSCHELGRIYVLYSYEEDVLYCMG